MKNDNKQNHDIPFKNQLILSYTIILAIILIIGVTLYYISYKQVKHGINQQNRLSMSASVTKLDSTMELMNAAVKQITSDRLFNNLSGLSREESNEFYYLGYQTQRSLKSVTPVELLLPISNSFIFMEKSRYVVSSTMFLDFDFFAANNTKYRLEPNSFSEALLSEAHWNRFTPMTDFEGNSKNFLYVYPLFHSIRSVSKPTNVLCYLFDYDMVTEYFSGINLYGDGYLIAYDKNGEPMFFFSDGAQAADYDTLKNLNYKNQIAHMVSKDNRQEMLVTSVSSSYNNWTYYLVQPENQAYYSITPYQRFFTIITIASFVAGGILVIIFSSFGSRYLAQLYNELVLKESVATSLNLLVEKQKPMVLESYMRRIMEGSITTNEEKEYLINELALEQPGVKYHVLYTEVSPSEDTHIHSHDMELLIQNYDTLVREALRRYYPNTGYIYKPSDRIFAILIASDQTVPYETVIAENKDTFNALHRELLEKYGIWISGGFGDRNGMISYTWKSYQQAKEAKSITTMEKYILSCDVNQSNDVYYYPESLSVQLSGFISSGNKDQVQELFKLIKNENTKKKNLSYTQLSWLVSDVRATVFKKRHNLLTEGMPAEKLKLLDMIDKQFEGEMSLNILETIALELCDVCGSEGNELILKIQEYINTNYHDPDLCLSKISQEFGISENYFSYLFKKEVSENFSIYLERLRMAKAKEIISETDTSLSTLYQYLGYNNAASFRRAFKKNFGVSPKEMRDKVNAK
ncbi:helix-turn-helix domain-containing protein [Lacrimispora sp. JR3]|uniref:helix-turn-helix domain-containing protein n=1 Tax=Lacrimispora sinapis TaxID=3111456 RepID=UPI003749D5E1